MGMPLPFFIYLSLLTFLFVSCEKHPLLSSKASRFIASEHLLKLDKNEELASGINTFLHEEQSLPPMSLINESVRSPKNNSAFSPENNPKFPLPYFLIPETDVTFLTSQSIDPKISDQIVMRISGKRHFKFFVHPEFENYFNLLRSAYNYVGVDNTEFFASPTSSYGSLVVWNRNNTKRKPFIAIVFLDQTKTPNIKISDLELSIANQKIQDHNEKTLLKNINLKIFPITSGFIVDKIHPITFKKSAGQLIREIPDEIITGQLQWHSLSVLMGTTKKNELFIMDIIRKSGLSSFDFFKNYFIDGYLDLFEELSLKNGINIEPYPQNLLFETTDKLKPTGKWIFRNFSYLWPLEENKEDFKKYKLKNFAKKSNCINSYVFFYKRQIFDKLLENVSKHDPALGPRETATLKELVDEKYRKLINSYLGLNLKSAPMMDNYKSIEEIIKIQTEQENKIKLKLE